MSKNTHFLYPAALFVSAKPYLITTILGSCVAVCLFDTKKQIGGMNHFMLPFWNGQGLASPKYGNIAIEKLIKKLEGLGCQRKDLVAKIFGGGEIIETHIKQFQIGERNIQVARETLLEENITIAGSSTGGRLGRKIIFNTQTGEVMQRYIKNSQDSPEIK
jgi:chemotaxis protein CheD